MAKEATENLPTIGLFPLEREAVALTFLRFFRDRDRGTNEIVSRAEEIIKSRHESLHGYLEDSTLTLKTLIGDGFSEDLYRFGFLLGYSTFFENANRRRIDLPEIKPEILDAHFYDEFHIQREGMQEAYAELDDRHKKESRKHYVERTVKAQKTFENSEKDVMFYISQKFHKLGDGADRYTAFFGLNSLYSVFKAHTEVQQLEAMSQRA
jgi:hypothetical protein